MKIGVIADDLTGAMDTGVQFVKYGLKTALQLKNQPIPDHDVEIINTDSREGSENIARRRVLEAVSLLEGRLLFKKIDSTLRGHLDAEITTILDVGNYLRAVICPAVIEEGRQVLDAQLWIKEKPLQETEFACDPTWPAKSSLIQDRFNENIFSIPLSVVRSDKENLQRYLFSSGERFIVPDTTDINDLVHIAEAINSLKILPCGGMSFARAWISELTKRDPIKKNVRFKVKHPVLFVAGSHHPRTHEQLRVLLNTQEIIEVVVTSSTPDNIKSPSHSLKNSIKPGKSILIRTPIDDIPSDKNKNAMLKNLAIFTKTILESYPVNALVVCGGETASAVLNVLSSTMISVHGEIVPGFPYGVLTGGGGDNLPILTKSGGFGVQEILTYIF